jgi:predicted small lipoprotein YifL
MRQLLLLSCLLLAACGNSGTFNFPKKDPSVNQGQAGLHLQTRNDPGTVRRE